MIVLLGGASRALAQAGAPEPASAQAPLSLTLEDAVRRGVEQAPRLAEARARESSAQATVSSREALAKPGISASTSYLRTNHVIPFGFGSPTSGTEPIFPDIPNNYRVRAEMTVPVYTAGRVSSLVDAAEADVRAAGHDRKTTEEDVRIDLVRAYWALVTAREAERVLVQSLERADAAVSDVKARVDAGVLPPNDLLSIQAQRAREAVRLVQAKNAVAATMMNLDRLIGEDPGRQIVPATGVDVVLPAAGELAAQPIEALIARAREQRTERASLTDRQASLRAAGEASLASLRPQLGALVAVEPTRPNQRFVPKTDDWKTSFDLGVTLTWPLFDGGKARADNAVALAQAEALGHRLHDFDAALAVEVRQRLLDLESGRAALAASAEAVAAATEARRVVQERFRAGVATSTEVLDAQQELLEAELERTRLSATQRLNEAELVRTVGGR
jgi:outer membrane protein TolC